MKKQKKMKKAARLERAARSHIVNMEEGLTTLALSLEQLELLSEMAEGYYNNIIELGANKKKDLREQFDLLCILLEARGEFPRYEERP